MDANGNVVLAGEMAGTVSFGGAPLVAADADLFVAKLALDATHLWSARFGDDGGAQRARGAAITTDGGVVLTGEMAGTMDLGVAELTSNGSHDVAVVWLAP